jgi:voltage-gated potassium channel Kch
MRHVVVCGLGRLGLNIVQALRAAGAAVTVISDPETSADRRERAMAAGARIVTGDFRFPSVRGEADVAGAQSVILATANDVANLEAALEIRGEAPAVPVVMRHSDPDLTPRFEADFGIAAAIAPAVLAADSFVEAALSAPATQGRNMSCAGRFAVPRRPIRLAFIVIPMLLFALYLGAIVVFRQTLDLEWIDAAYFATSVVTTVGFGDFNLQFAPVWVKVFGIVLMFSGIVLIAIIASLLTLFIVSGTADQLHNEFHVRLKTGHVVVCGLGHVGVAVARGLRARGIPVVVVDPAASDDAHRELHLRCPMIVGDATRPVVLGRAGIARARALIACTANDALNLEIGLTAQAVNEQCRASQPLRVVLRCFDADLARRIHAVSSNYTLLSEASIASPVFVKKALEAAAS